jgi:hypothetical protein
MAVKRAYLVAILNADNLENFMSMIENAVCEKLQSRAAVGKQKYGVTLERNDLTLVSWLTHLQEELMDATVYLEKVIQILESGNKLFTNLGESHDNT